MIGGGREEMWFGCYIYSCRERKRECIYRDIVEERERGCMHFGEEEEEGVPGNCVV